MKKYKVNEIFYSIQAEGRNAGKPAIFIRFSGCNLKCPFCDTDHNSYTFMTARDIENVVLNLTQKMTDKPIIVFTGGEPCLQLSDDEELLSDFYRAIETNGLLKIPKWINWRTVSPKILKGLNDALQQADEIKLVYGTFDFQTYKMIENLSQNKLLYMQPMANEIDEFDIEPAVEFCKQNPRWTLSLQWHKLFNLR